MSTLSLASIHDKPAVLRDSLVFSVGAEEYAIDTTLVQELRDFDHVTRLAGVPAWLLGIINLRGNIMPLIDLRLRYGQVDPDYDATTVVIVLSSGLRHAAMVVDRVADVVQLEPRHIQPAPTLPTTALAPPLSGIAMLGDRLLAMLDGDALLRQLDTPINALAA
ncbi:MAG: chemotaxis protein CheW [Sphingomonadaceae bacterium]